MYQQSSFAPSQGCPHVGRCYLVLLSRGFSGGENQGVVVFGGIRGLQKSLVWVVWVLPAARHSGQDVLGGSFIYDQEMITDVPLARSRFQQGSISHQETGNHLASDQNSHWPVGSCSCSSWSLRVSFYFLCQQQRSWAAHGRLMPTSKASISDPRGHTNLHTSPVEAAEAWNNWSTSYFGESKNSFTVLDSKKIVFQGYGRIKFMQRVRYTIPNIVMIKWEASDQHGIYQCAWNYARANQWWICYGMILSYWKIFDFLYFKWSFFPSLFLYLSVDRLVFPFSPSLFTRASLCQPTMPISTLIAKNLCLFASWLFPSPGFSGTTGFTVGASYSFGNSWITKQRGNRYY